MNMIFIMTAFLLTGVPTDTWERLTSEQQAGFVLTLGRQYFEGNPLCRKLHVWAEDDGEVTAFYGECEEAGT